MAAKIVVPDAGQTTDELVLLKWHVAVGDAVAAGDLIADIETDKAIAELESYAGGVVLARLVEEGDLVQTGQVLLWIGERGERVPEEKAADAEHLTESRSDATEAPARTEPVDHRTRATPAARTVARQRHADLQSVAGTGPGGCVVKRDVLAATEPAKEATELRGTRVPLTGMRRALAARLQHSAREAPQFQVTMEVDMTSALAARQTLDPQPTLTDFFVKAAADTLVEFPQVNCRLEEDAIHYLEDINLGIAVSVDDGLVVPVLAHADRLSLPELAKRTRSLISNARAGRLPAGVQGTFTVSNLGMHGVKSFTALVNPPEAAILAVGAVEDKLTLTDSGIATVPTVTLTLSCDHRVIDGVMAAQFLGALKGSLMGPWLDRV